MWCVSKVRFSLFESDKEPEILTIDLAALLVELVSEWTVFGLLDEVDICESILVNGDVAFALWAYFL